MRASTIGPTAAARAWCCSPSRSNARSRPCAPPAATRRRRRWSAFRPAGALLRQATVARFAESAGAILLCARYEGIDQRFVDAHVDLELSIGDYVLSGGELPALVLLDAVARLQPGVLGDARSHQQDSFSAGLLEGPHFSRPERLAGGGRRAAGAAVGRPRRDRRSGGAEQSLALTAERRPDLLARARADGLLDAGDEAYLARRAAPKL